MLERLPHRPESAEPAAAGQTGTPFRLPDIGIEIAKASVDMKLGSALTEGNVEPLRADGSARYGMGDGIHFNLDAIQGGPGGSRLTARIHANPDDETLDLDVHAHEAKGGLVSRLIGVAEQGPFDVDVSGDGTLMSWNGKAKAALGPDGRLDATIKAFGNEMPRFAIKGRVTMPPPVSGRLARIGAPPYDFDIEFAVADNGSLTFSDTTLKSAGASLVANGSLDLPDGSIDMALALNSGQRRGARGLVGSPVLAEPFAERPSAWTCERTLCRDYGGHAQPGRRGFLRRPDEPCGRARLRYRRSRHAFHFRCVGECRQAHLHAEGRGAASVRRPIF